MKRTRLAVYLALFLLGGTAGAAPDTAPAPPPITAPMDLKTGKVDVTPVGPGETQMGTAYPQTPPQTVEGVLVSLDTAGRTAIVRTLRDGDVKIGLPEGIILSREGETDGCTLEDIKPGDRVFATVVTANGTRALRLSSNRPLNPMVNYVGIPVLCLLALVIWRIRCKPLPGAAPATSAPKAA